MYILLSGISKIYLVLLLDYIIYKWICRINRLAIMTNLIY